MYTLSLSAPVPSLTYHVALFWFSSKSLLLLKVTIDAALIILITHHVCFNLRLVSWNCFSVFMVVMQFHNILPLPPLFSDYSRKLLTSISL